MAETPGQDSRFERHGECITLLLENDRAQIDAAREQLVEDISRAGFDDSSTFAIRLAFEETVSNAFRHGHKQLDPSVPVRVEYQVIPGRVVLTVEDQGPGFDPANVSDPTAPENVELPGGRGLLLIRAYMAEVEYNDTGNRVTMVYTGKPATS
ncbi:MAG: ATP-binding protein [Phycisphaeraceae bacterium]|nr:ATP-binding protein [Phycisphaerales bacterium]MCB9859105.1 ATP-binding protein [Phycisphaeraceae bacterium]